MRADDEFFRERRERREARGERKPKRERAAPTPREDRRSMREFVRTRTGVEAYVEPRTLDQPFSAVLVAHDGEWLRFHLPNEAFLRKLAAKHRLPIYDVALMGYPRRMKEYRRGGGASGSPEGSPGGGSPSEP
jgi:hypothetical protein